MVAEAARKTVRKPSRITVGLEENYIGVFCHRSNVLLPKDSYWGSPWPWKTSHEKRHFGRQDPFEALKFEAPLEELKARLEKGEPVPRPGPGPWGWEDIRIVELYNLDIFRLLALI